MPTFACLAIVGSPASVVEASRIPRLQAGEYVKTYPSCLHSEWAKCCFRGLDAQVAPGAALLLDQVEDSEHGQVHGHQDRTHQPPHTAIIIGPYTGGGL